MTHAVHAKYVAGYILAAHAGRTIVVSVENFYVPNLNRIAIVVDSMGAGTAAHCVSYVQTIKKVISTERKNLALSMNKV